MSAPTNALCGSKSLEFEIIAADGRARATRLAFNSCTCFSPMFMPVGTQGALGQAWGIQRVRSSEVVLLLGSVKGLTSKQMEVGISCAYFSIPTSTRLRRPLSETFFLSVPQFHLPLKIRKLDARWYLGTHIIWRIAPARAYFSILADFPLLSTGTAVPWQTAAASRWWASLTWRTFRWGSSRFQ